MRWTVGLLVVPVGVALLSGCASTTTIDFADPPGSELTIKRRDFVFPVAVKLSQRTPSLKPDSKGYDIEIDIPDDGNVIATQGKLYVYEVILSDVDRLARNYFRIPKERIESLKRGAAVTIEGFSADGGKAVYRAVLGLKKVESELPVTL